jgi:hypothetical protein
MAQVEAQAEPPSTCSVPAPRLFRVGRDRAGRWVAQDQNGLCGGLFVDRAEALKFAMFENGNRPQAVIMVPGVLELDMGKTPQATDTPRPAVDAALARAA